MTGRVERSEYYILGGILLLAFALRIWGLNAPLWHDEIVSLDQHIGLPWGELMQSYEMNFHYLHNMQAKLFVSIFGESAWALRIPAMIFGVGTVGAIWWLAREVSDRWTALITALLIAISFHQIWFSQNARGYTELAFWSTLGMIFFLNGMRSPNWKIWGAYALCLFFAVATHLTGAFFFVAQGLVWLTLAVRKLPKEGLKSDIVIWPAFGYLVGGAMIILFYTPVMMSLFETVGTLEEGNAVDAMTEYRNPFWTIVEGIQTAFGSLGSIAGVIALGVLTLVGLGAYSVRERGGLLAIILVLHIGLTIALLMALGMRVWPRFFFVDIGFLMLFIVLGVRLSVKIFTSYIDLVPMQTLYPIAVAAMVLVSIPLAARNYAAPKQDQMGAYQVAEAARTNDTRIYGVGVAASYFVDYSGADWGVIETDEALQVALADPGPAILVVAFPERTFRTFPTLELMRTEGMLETIEELPGTLGDGAMFVFRRA